MPWAQEWRNIVYLRLFPWHPHVFRLVAAGISRRMLALSSARVLGGKSPSVSNQIATFKFSTTREQLLEKFNCGTICVRWCGVFLKPEVLHIMFTNNRRNRIGFYNDADLRFMCCQGRLRKEFLDYEPLQHVFCFRWHRTNNFNCLLFVLTWNVPHITNNVSSVLGRLFDGIRIFQMTRIIGLQQSLSQLHFVRQYL